MALSATCGTLYRNLDSWYICYDNDAYGNTGMQQSSATPYATHTTTTTGGRCEGAGIAAAKKDIFEIWHAHRPPYTVTVSPRHPVDLARKFEKAKRFKGPKLSLAFALCPTGWLYDVHIDRCGGVWLDSGGLEILVPETHGSWLVARSFHVKAPVHRPKIVLTEEEMRALAAYSSSLR